MDTPHPEATVRAKVGRSRWLSPIWAIPIVTALIAGYLVWHEFAQRGPTIVLTFRSADGLTAGQSQVRLREVSVGTVEAIALSPDREGVEITVRMNREAAPLLTGTTRFWVVKPRLFAGSISGLGTLLSGSYIQMMPGAGDDQRPRRYTGLEDPPIVPTGEPGRTVQLRADRLGSISLGSPVFFRDFDVGQVLGWDIADMADFVTIQAFIRAPFDGYLREGSRFWNASGVAVKLGADGVQLQFESLRAVILGGIAFETPEAARHGPVPGADQTFRLYATKELANDAAIRRRIPVVSYFTDSVSGLSPGAPVTFQGVRIGEVIGFDLVYDVATDSLRVPVRYEIEPERVTGVVQAESRGAVENAQLLVRQGMRARLASANLITGQQQISLEMVADAAPAEIEMKDGVMIFPSAPGQFASIVEGVNRVLARIEALPLRDIADNLNSTIAGIDALVRGPELTQAVTSLNNTLQAAEETVRRIDAAAGPALRGLPQVVANVNTALQSANRLVVSANRGYGDESQFRRDLDRMMEQITVASRSLRSLADQLNRNPEALIRGRSSQAP